MNYCLLLAQSVDQATGGLKGEVNDWWLMVPTAALFIGIASLLGMGQAWIQKIDSLLRTTKTRRAGIIVVGNVGLPIVVAVCIDLLDLSEVLDLKVRMLDIIVGTGVVLAGLCGLFFQFALFLHEDRWSETVLEAEERARLAQVTKENLAAKLNRALGIMLIFRGVVELKAARVRELVSKGGSVTPEALKECLNPDVQIVSILEMVYQHFWRLLANQHGVEAKLALVYFEPRDGFLTPSYATDGVKHDSNPPIQETHKAFFQLSAPRACSAAVYSARHRELLIIEDAKVADGDVTSPFHFFPNQDQSSLQSMVVIPVAPTIQDGVEPRVVCVYTDQVGFFSPDDKSEIQVLAENIRDRVLFELDIRAILESRAGDLAVPSTGE